MSRSIKKGPYVDEKLLKRVLRQKQVGDRGVLRTWVRRCTIPPDFVNHTFDVHNGRKFIKVFVTEDMVGHKLGEFAHTRSFKGHTARKVAAAPGAAAPTA